MKVLLSFYFGLAFLVSGCFERSNPKTLPLVENEIRLGEFGAMTGTESVFGTDTHKGIWMAVEEANRKGGIRKKNIKVITYDTEGKAEKAISAVTQLINQDRVHVILGEVASSLSLAAAPVAQSYQVPMISPASTHPKITQLGNYIFRSCFIEPFQGSVMAKFAINHLNLKKAAILRDQESEYSHALANFFSDDFKKMGGQILIDLNYSSRTENYRTQLQKIKTTKADIIFIPGYYREVEKIIPLAKEIGIRAVLLGGDGWDGLKLRPQDQSPLLPAYFSNHFSADDKNEVVQGFVSRFEEQYGHRPNGLAALGYDAASIVIDAIQRSSDLSHKNIREAVASTRNFQGVTGVISINSERNAIKPAVVLKVEPSGTFSYVASINP
ncbi:MAG: ABC transporter substrate-binding protein [Proteobacteria bacterium]|nr:ABC transporter substrate-binding protein [Pseudomonadota bacterium]